MKNVLSSLSLVCLTACGAHNPASITASTGAVGPGDAVVAPGQVLSCDTIDRQWPRYSVQFRPTSGDGLDAKVIRATAEAEGTVAHLPAGGSMVGNVIKIHLAAADLTVTLQPDTLYRGTVTFDGAARPVGCALDHDMGALPDQILHLDMSKGAHPVATLSDWSLVPAGSTKTLATVACSQTDAVDWSCSSSAYRISFAALAPRGPASALVTPKDGGAALSFACIVPIGGHPVPSSSQFECDQTK